jgi:hypothetical protein
MTPAQANGMAGDTRGPVDQRLTAEIEGFRGTLGEPIYAEILRRAGHSAGARAIDRWIAGGEIYGGAESRLRFAFQVARTLSEHDSPAVVQAWRTGVNLELGDRVPLRLMREHEIDAVAPAILSAARAFLAGA